MIDDHLKNLDYFDGEKLLFTATHNIHTKGYTRVNNWAEVRALLLERVSREETKDTKFTKSLKDGRHKEFQIK
jgi:hypothetical protein